MAFNMNDEKEFKRDANLIEYHQDDEAEEMFRFYTGETWKYYKKNNYTLLYLSPKTHEDD